MKKGASIFAALAALVIASCASSGTVPKEPLIDGQAQVLEIRQGVWTSTLGPSVLAVGQHAVRIRITKPAQFAGSELVLGITDDSQLVLAGGHRLAVGDAIAFSSTEAVLSGDVLPPVFANLRNCRVAEPDGANRPPR